MLVYVLAALACVTAALGYEQYPESLKVLIALGAPVYIQATRNTRLRLDIAFTTLMLCVCGVGAGLFVATFLLSGLHLAAAAAGLVLASILCASWHEIPVGVRVMRSVFRGR